MSVFKIDAEDPLLMTLATMREKLSEISREVREAAAGSPWSGSCTAALAMIDQAITEIQDRETEITTVSAQLHTFLMTPKPTDLSFSLPPPSSSSLLAYLDSHPDLSRDFPVHIPVLRAKLLTTPRSSSRRRRARSGHDPASDSDDDTPVDHLDLSSHPAESLNTEPLMATISEERPMCPKIPHCDDTDPEHYLVFCHTPLRPRSTSAFVLAQWLTSIGVPPTYEALFQQNGISQVADVKALTDEKLRACGVERKGHRKRILGRAKALRAEDFREQGSVTPREKGEKKEEKGKKAKAGKGKRASLRHVNANAPNTNAATNTNSASGFEDVKEGKVSGGKKEAKRAGKAHKVEHDDVLVSVDFSRQQLTEFPLEALRRTDATLLNLYLNKLETIPPEIGRLTSLTALGLNENHLKSLPLELGHLRNLRTLDLRSNKLTELDGAILQNLTSLAKLFVRHNKLTSLPAEMVQLQQLDLLSARFNHIAAPLPDLGKLLKLKVLDLSGNKLDEFCSIASLHELRELDLKQNSLVALPDRSWGSLQALTRVDLALNHLTACPPCVFDLVNLEVLDLESNQISVIPDGVGRLEKLERLYISRNQITVLPPAMGRLKALRELRCKGNHLSSVPLEMGHLHALKELDLSTNDFEEFPETILLPGLQTLVLADNEIARLPSEIGRMVALRVLDCDANQLEAIPQTIGALTALRELRLGCNDLLEIPEEVGELIDLKMLYLEHNRLREVPASVGNLSLLNKLILSDNDLEDLPNELVFLDSLQELKVDSNPMSRIPEAKRGGNAAYHFLIKRAATVHNPNPKHGN